VPPSGSIFGTQNYPEKDELLGGFKGPLSDFWKIYGNAKSHNTILFQALFASIIMRK